MERAGIDHAESLRRSLEFYQLKDKDGRQGIEKQHGYHEKRVAEAQVGATLSVTIGQLQRDMVSLFFTAKAMREYCRARRGGAQGRAEPGDAQSTDRSVAGTRPSRPGQNEQRTMKRWRRTVCIRSAFPVDGCRDHKGKRSPKACLAHRRAAPNTIIKSQCDTYADEFTEWSWAMLHKSEPDWAAEKAMFLHENELAQMSREIGRQLTSLSTSDAYRQHWSLLMQGQVDEANDVLRRLADKGVPLPK